MVYIKVDDDGNIIGHDHRKHGDFSIPINRYRLIDEKGRYAFSYFNDTLILLSENEKENHPVVIKNKRTARLVKLINKSKNLVAMKEVRLHGSLSIEEKQELDDMIAAEENA